MYEFFVMNRVRTRTEPGPDLEVRVHGPQKVPGPGPDLTVDSVVLSCRARSSGREILSIFAYNVFGPFKSSPDPITSSHR